MIHRIHNFFYILLFGLCFISSIMPEEETQVHIRLYNKTIYFLDSPILIRIDINNDSSRPYPFKLADKKIFNIIMKTYTENNQELPVSRDFIIQRSAQHIYFREVLLEPGETISFTEELRKYISITSPGIYTVQVSFFPELYQSSKNLLISNTLQIVIRPGNTEIGPVKQGNDLRRIQTLNKEEFSPDQVVSYMIHARQNNDWDRFFLYIDLESFLKGHITFWRQYQWSSEEKRISILDTFKKKLQSGNIDTNIIMIPSSFRVLKTDFGPRDGQVLVEEIFDYQQYQEIKHYTYYLRRRDYWYISGYNVANIGSRKKP